MRCAPASAGTRRATRSSKNTGKGKPRTEWSATSSSTSPPASSEPTLTSRAARPPNFLELASAEGEEGVPKCPDSTAVGTSETLLRAGFHVGPVYNLQPPPGVVVKLGYWVVHDAGDHRSRGQPEAPLQRRRGAGQDPADLADLRGSLDLWGVPASPVHDPERGHCFVSHAADACSSNAPESPVLHPPDQLHRTPRHLLRDRLLGAPGCVSGRRQS